MQNNNHTIEYLLHELRGLTLADKAKARLRAELSTYADFHAAVPQKTAVLGATGGAFAWLSVRAWYRAGAALLAVLLIAGGTAYASDSALPGNPLYTVKVNIKEPIEVALATSPRAKAEKHVELAEKRLEEAAKLAVSEGLDEETQVYLEQEFGEHVDSTLAAAGTLEESGEAEASLDVRSHLEASLVAHADILDLVEDSLDEPGDEDRIAHASTQNLLRSVKLRQEVVSETRVALERDLEDDATQSDTLALVTEAAGSVTAEGEASLLPSVVEHLAESGEALAEAKESLRHDGPDDMRRAFRKAREAGRASEVVSTLLRNKDILMAIGKPATTTPETATTTESAVEPVNSTESF
ncbi:MAG: hypothetical protein QOE22_19 [Candidatus Parcubacteria bacterium]|jgi:hypothetical protein|nr:hypothetical protein [Candidatus Parcubacteria bacterium]